MKHLSGSLRLRAPEGNREIMTRIPRSRRSAAPVAKQQLAVPRTRQPKEIPFVVCPLCSMVRVLEATKPEVLAKGRGRANWDSFDPETSPLVQIRVSGGKKPSAASTDDLTTGVRKPGRHYPGSAPGSGFQVVRTLTWRQALADPAYADQLQAITEQLERLLECFKAAVSRL